MTINTPFDHRPDCQLLTVETYGLCTCDFDRRAENRERRREAWKRADESIPFHDLALESPALYNQFI